MLKVEFYSSLNVRQKKCSNCGEWYDENKNHECIPLGGSGDLKETIDKSSDGDDQRRAS